MLENPGRRRSSTPHIVAPTIHSLRDSMIGSSLVSSQRLSSSYINDNSNNYGTINDNNNEHSGLLTTHDEVESGYQGTTKHISFDAATGDNSLGRRRPLLYRQWQCVEQAATQIPSIILITVFHLLVGIPFGVSYFPIGWKGTASMSSQDVDDVSSESTNGFTLDGQFPLQGKEALGIRMFLFSTIIGQLVMTYASSFNNCIALQMVENAPFCQALTYIVVETQGYGKEALSTLFFLFGLASVIVGSTFYLLGRFQLGKVLYFFPTHVLVGCIGGIGIFIGKTGMEVTANASFPAFLETDKLHLLLIVFAFEAGLRLLTYMTKDETGQSKYPLLSPIYFILITPLFYGCMNILGQDFDDQYFFPAIVECVDDDTGSCDTVTSAVFDIFHLIDFSTISWEAVLKSIPTLMSLVMFSLIHVPINIPAFSVSTDVDIDMNVELMAHGYSNGLVGLFGGLQNYMAYTQSMIYSRSGGYGKLSSLAVAVSTSVLFFIGPHIASYLPKCMAGTLLLHCGIDLFVEGCIDSYGQYDYLEYFGIWCIALVMTCLGMEAALVAGAFSALLTYAIQSVAYPKPIRGSMSGATLRSSEWNRSLSAFAILDSSETGRIHIRVVQLQGHLFFGNITLFSDGVKELIRNNYSVDERPYIIIMDFTLVLGIDSSAAQSIIKLRDSLTNQFGIKLCIFVHGSTDGFPCEINLSELLNSPLPNDGCGSVQRLLSTLSGSKVCDSLDEGLIFAEDSLIAMVNPNLLFDNIKQSFLDSNDNIVKMTSIEEEQNHAIDLLLRKCPGEERNTVEKLLSYFTREVYNKGDVLWKQGSKSDCAKLLVSGDLLASLENEAGTTETISIGSMIGESGLVENCNRNSTVNVLDDSILYSLSRDSWEDMKEKDAKCAHLMYAIVVRYLTLRVQHCSNRIFETRCLPV